MENISSFKEYCNKRHDVALQINTVESFKEAAKLRDKIKWLEQLERNNQKGFSHES